MTDDVDILLGQIDACERAGFPLNVWCEWKRRPDGKRSNEIVEHLSIRDPDRPGRWPPDRLVLPLMARARAVRGYLRRVRSPFFDGDRRAALTRSIADDRRLAEHGR